MGTTLFSKRLPDRTYVRRPRTRARSFKTEEKAREYAKNNNIQNYTVKKLSDHKFRIDKQ